MRDGRERRDGKKENQNLVRQLRGWAAVLFIHCPREKKFEWKKHWGKKVTVVRIGGPRGLAGSTKYQPNRLVD